MSSMASPQHLPRACLHNFICNWARLPLSLLGCKKPRQEQYRSKSLTHKIHMTTMSSMNLSHQLELVFRLIDENGDGKISRLELSHLLGRLGRESPEAADDMLREMDANGDGYVDLCEFMQIVGKGDDEDEELIRRFNGCKDDDLMEAFLIFDCDRNGLISPNELLRVLVSLGDTKSTINDCVLMIKGVDRNGDGHVDFDEFRHMMLWNGRN